MVTIVYTISIKYLHENCNVVYVSVSGNGKWKDEKHREIEAQRKLEARYRLLQKLLLLPAIYHVNKTEIAATPT